MRTEKENLAIASLVCGILGIVGGSIPYVGNFTLVLSILGIVFGCISKKHVAGNYHTMALAGLITGAVGIAVTILVFVLVFVLMGGMFALVGTAIAAEEMAYATAMLI